MDPQIPKCFYRISIKALILDPTRTKFLITQEDNGKWELPGGGLEWGENPHESLSREIREEMGLTVTSISPSPSYFITCKRVTNDTYIANIIYEVTVANLDFTPSEECVALKFVSPEDVKDMDVFPNVTRLAEVFKSSSHIFDNV